ncbi:hypothetical protein CO230_10060 [Chryseobacterium sp. 6424]|uniref:DUF6370 family protein n=1 Tax=Chryseobacterium sp. 6424 TaxID=2039166 RepID=UPI000EFBF546|nr:DUF6370 family protein [Chryseobacterium sp. 6424]AYO58430.1 hypothetical protein CO230_10060 [Chryseobacterium sp. 6424]
MRKLLSLFFLFGIITLSAQQVTFVKKVVEASCGQCQFKMKDKKGCDLAIRTGGKSYFVDGTKIDDHGDAHATHGFCNTVRQAEVSGTVQNGVFVATYFRLLPLDTKKP